MTATNFVKQKMSFRNNYSGSKSFFYELLFRPEFQRLLIDRVEPSKNCLFKVNNTKMCDICSKVINKDSRTIVLMSLLLTLNIFDIVF